MRLYVDLIESNRKLREYNRSIEYFKCEIFSAAQIQAIIDWFEFNYFMNI